MKWLIVVALCLASVSANASWFGRLLGMAESKIGLQTTNTVEYTDGDGQALTNGVTERKRTYATFTIAGTQHETWDVATKIVIPKPTPPPVPPTPPVVTNPVTPPVVTNGAPDPVPTNEPPAVSDFDGVTKWNGADSSKWPETVHIDTPKVIGGNIAWMGGFERVGKWNEIDNGKCVNGETCLIFGGMAGHFDYLGCEQTVKTLSNVPGYFGRMPRSGERVGLFIETINRDKGNAKMKERSNVVWFIWP